jgi:ribosomal-protein-alanine N-acetyltransferase
MTDTTLETRRLVFADLPNVIAIERRAFPTPWSLAMFVLELSKPEGICLAAQRDGQLVGYIICSRFDQVWHIMNVSVDPDLQRQGIATEMIDEILRRVGEEGQITLEVRPTNSAAIALYERFGFLAAGTRPRYYQDNGEDAVIMWRTQATLRGELDDVPAAPARPVAAP